MLKTESDQLKELVTQYQHDLLMQSIQRRKVRSRSDCALDKEGRRPNSPALDTKAQKDIHNLLTAIVVAKREEDTSAANCDEHVFTFAGSHKTENTTRSNSAGKTQDIFPTSESGAEADQARDTEIACLRQRIETLQTEILSAGVKERRQLASELHDVVGHKLAALKMNLQLLSRQVDEAPRLLPDNCYERIHEAVALSKEAIKRIRQITSGMRESELGEDDLTEAICNLTNRFHKQTGIDVCFEGEEQIRVRNALIETNLIRVTQEALTNIAKHAQAKHIDIRLEIDTNSICLQIVDDGIGFDMNDAQGNNSFKRSSGLKIMHERIASCGGNVMIDAKPGNGTAIVVEVPLPEHATPGENS